MLKTVKHWYLPVIGGIILIKHPVLSAMSLAFILLWEPQLAGLSAVIWVSIAIILMGIFNLALGLQLKKLQ